MGFKLGFDEQRVKPDFQPSTVRRLGGLEEASRTGEDGLLRIVLLAVAPLGTWLIWDLLRMGPSLMPEIILDGVIVPAHPEIEERIPCEPWYKTAFAGTGLHFAGATLCTVVLVSAGHSAGCSRIITTIRHAFGSLPPVPTRRG
jgi:hypothetical protein